MSSSLPSNVGPMDLCHQKLRFSMIPLFTLLLSSPTHKHDITYNIYKTLYCYNIIMIHFLYYSYLHFCWAPCLWSLMFQRKCQKKFIKRQRNFLQESFFLFRTEIFQGNRITPGFVIIRANQKWQVTFRPCTLFQDQKIKNFR